MANEGDRAVEFCRAVLRQCSGFRRVTFFSIFDRANKDLSFDQMRQFSLTEPRLRVVWADESRCVVDAYMHGYREALRDGCDWILEIDAGFSHQPEEVPQFFDAMDTGIDCVFGSRFIGRFIESSLKRRFISWGGTRITNLLLGTSQTDMTSGFELFSRDALNMVLSRGVRSKAHFFQTEIKVFCRNLRFVEVPITYRAASPRLGSASIREAFVQLWHLFHLRLKEQL